MELIGVPHSKMFLDGIDRYISQTHPEGIESLMVELPPNWPELSRIGFEMDFFGELAKRYEQKGTRIVYGDRGRKIPQSLSGILWDVFFKSWYYRYDAFTTRKRDKAMVQAIKEERPEIVVVGRRHANYLKDEFPDAYYVAFDVSFRRCPPLYVTSKITGKSNKPDRTIRL